jgi:hypothetical protein
MIDNDLLLKLAKASTTQAVKYVHETTNKPIPECKDFVTYYKIEAGIDVPVGTITWFDCDKVKPPILEITELGSYSVEVLITDKINIHKSKFCRAIDGSLVGWFGQNIFGFTPTHWAFINFPV